MKKIIVSEFFSLDGVMSATSDDPMQWVTSNWTDKASAYEERLFDRIDTLMLGGISYDMLGNYWPNVAQSPNAPQSDIELSKKVNAVNKVVVTKTPTAFHWPNTRQIDNLDKETILELKEQPGKDILIVGSATIVQQLTNIGLVDEFHFMVYPVILSEGKPLFQNLKHEVKLNLISTEDLGNSILLVQYDVVRSN